MEHVPVLRNDVQKYLALKGGEKVIDMTLGLGGHALDILKKIGKKGTLIAFEQDERNLMEAQKRLEEYKSQIVYFNNNFRYLKSRITARHEASPKGERSVLLSPVDAILFDLGLSSPHVDDPERGFSFMKEGPLDMRFDQSGKLTAAIVVNTYPEERLADIFFNYGEERMSRKIARSIVTQRKIKPFETTKELADFIQQVMPVKHFKKGKMMHPATRIFQAIRIEVNDELNALKEALEQSMEVLKINGRIVVISYHSLEDRIVKQFFKKLEHPPVKSQEMAIYRNYDEPIVKILTKKPVIPTEEEIQENPRSRSAKLRAYEKILNP